MESNAGRSTAFLPRFGRVFFTPHSVSLFGYRGAMLISQARLCQHGLHGLYSLIQFG